MAQPNTGTCSAWATEADVCSPCDDYTFDTGVLPDMLQVATDVLFNLTGRQWPGVCSETIRPCGIRSGRGGTRPRSYGDHHYRGDWCGCNRPRSCGCRRLPEFRLPNYPVIEVTEVKIDGAVLPGSEYRVDDWRYLVRLPDADDVRDGWPCCQDLALADTEDDTWSVAYSWGADPPQGGVVAAAALGCQLALACNPEAVAGGQCRLASNVQSVVRQGVSMEFGIVMDPTALFTDGRTGLPEVDLWVASVNHGRLRRRGTVMIPGKGRSVRRVDT